MGVALIPAMAERPEPVVDELGFEAVAREPRAESAPIDEAQGETSQPDGEAADAESDAAQSLETGPDETALTPELAVELGHG
jgi:hypothetical protein